MLEYCRYHTDHTVGLPYLPAQTSSPNPVFEPIVGAYVVPKSIRQNLTAELEGNELHPNTRDGGVAAILDPPLSMATLERIFGDSSSA
ncbi:hypothetical protein FSP39_009424 [Pinctada imbricata]|uniref:Uncharacterized protein n=1 Tax=Pinctada imbricata TaxID=66713 RepID=A0AA88XR06_PINIB|nr:hypothetical protein FSP39_009424 [Pinctada imbricata]